MTTTRPPLFKTTHMLHGGDYSPEQWTPERWDEDLRLMELAHCNNLSFGIFAWAYLEPQEGQYDFDWLDRMMDKAAQANTSIFLSTPSAAPPIWMAKKYPDIQRVAEDGERFHPGNRVNYCQSSPRYREFVAAMDRKLAQRYAQHPALKLWHVSNEYCFHCFCDTCQAEFRRWLEQRYGTLDALNRAWWTSFWSQRFSHWDEIEAPGGKRIMSLEGQWVDWKRFQTDQMLGLMKVEIAAIREYSKDTPATTNFMGTHELLNYWKFVPELNVISHDAYPPYHDRPDNARVAAEEAFHFDLLRAMSGGAPWLMMESTPSSTNWMEIGKLKRPGVHMNASIQAIAHGADGVLYFQWRKGLGGREKFHGAVMDHANDHESRVFREVAEVGQALEKLSGVCGATTRAEVAVIYDWENRWAIDSSCGMRKKKKDYLDTCRAHHRAFWERGVPVDVVSMDADFSMYKVVVAPMLFMVRKGVGEALTRFVADGGTLVATYWSGIVDDSALCFTTGFPGPLREVLGIRSEELDALYDDECVEVQSSDSSALNGSWQGHTFADLIHAEDADVVATFTNQFYAGRPAITCNRHGNGTAWYIAFRGNDQFQCDLADRLITDANLRRALDADLPDGVTAQVRTNADREFIFVMNCNRTEATVDPGTGPFIDALSGMPLEGGAFTLPPYGIRVFERTL